MVLDDVQEVEMGKGGLGKGPWMMSMMLFCFVPR
jgi:hypothetical protein